MIKKEDNTLIQNVLGNSNRIKVLECFLTFRKIDLDVKQILEETKMSRKTLDNQLNELKKNNLIKINRRIGNNNLWVIQENQITYRLMQLYDTIIKNEMRQM
jgi:predicted transcriptional regulator